VGLKKAWAIAANPKREGALSAKVVGR